MSEPLASELGVGRRELVALVGAGGKSTLLFRLGHELAAGGAKVLLATTTKMGSDQAKCAPVVCVPADAGAALGGPGPVMVVATDDGHKVTGPSPAEVDALFATSGADYVLVEADGARGKSFKTPAAHEPVIPSDTTLVVIVMGIGAIGRPIVEECHRPELVAHLAGLRVHDVLEVDAAVRVVTHPDGVLGAVPAAARVVVAITPRAGETTDLRADLAGQLGDGPRIERVILI